MAISLIPSRSFQAFVKNVKMTSERTRPIKRWRRFPSIFIYSFIRPHCTSSITTEQPNPLCYILLGDVSGIIKLLTQPRPMGIIDLAHLALLDTTAGWFHICNLPTSTEKCLSFMSQIIARENVLELTKGVLRSMLDWLRLRNVSVFPDSHWPRIINVKV